MNKIIDFARKNLPQKLGVLSAVKNLFNLYHQKVKLIQVNQTKVEEMTEVQAEARRKIWKIDFDTKWQEKIAEHESKIANQKSDEEEELAKTLAQAKKTFMNLPDPPKESTVISETTENAEKNINPPQPEEKTEYQSTISPQKSSEKENVTEILEQARETKVVNLEHPKEASAVELKTKTLQQTTNTEKDFAKNLQQLEQTLMKLKTSPENSIVKDLHQTKTDEKELVQKILEQKNLKTASTKAIDSTPSQMTLEKNIINELKKLNKNSSTNKQLEKIIKTSEKSTETAKSNIGKLVKNSPINQPPQRKKSFWDSFKSSSASEEETQINSKSPKR